MLLLVTRKSQWRKLKDDISGEFQEKVNVQQLHRHGQDLELMFINNPLARGREWKFHDTSVPCGTQTFAFTHFEQVVLVGI